eukprot:jgi/Tetstr1/445477/TSEL_033255.t1
MGRGAGVVGERGAEGCGLDHGGRRTRGVITVNPRARPLEADQVDPDRVSEQQPAKEDEDEAYGFGDNSPSQSDGSGGLWSYGSDEADDAGAPQSIQGSEPVNPVYVEEGSAEAGASGDFESDVLHSLAKAQNEEGHQACCCRSSACHCLSCMAICWRSTTCACLSCRITCWSNSACACSSSWRSTACAY